MVLHPCNGAKMTRKPLQPLRVTPSSGVTVTRKGYVRVTKGKYRHWYYHRKVIDELLKEQPHPVFGTEIPENFHVHHIDRDRRHNCACNLLLCDALIHLAFSTEVYRCPYTGRFLSKDQYEAIIDADSTNDIIPDWVTKEFEE